MFDLGIPVFEKVCCLVYGDLMLDRYWYGDTSRISPEAPVPVVNIERNKDCAGGAANVALNIASVGAKVILGGVVGQDEAARVLADILEEKSIQCCFHQEAHLRTTTKLRVMGRDQQLIRLDFEETQGHLNHREMEKDFSEALRVCDVVILSDYAKGALDHVEQLIALARRANKPVFVDPKHKSLKRYSGATLVTPNLKEFIQIVGPCQDYEEMEAKARVLLAEIDLQGILITLGKEGMLLVERDQASVHMPTRAREVFDVTGAGDTVIAILSAAYAAGASLSEAARLANMAAGIVVGKLGAASVSLPELRRALQRFNHSHLGVLTEEDLLLAVEDARAHGEKVVFTNGCFDILHAGHVQYLEKARALGDRLIVAVNDDASVQRLKGPMRPYNTLEERMDVIAGLRTTDWVVAFSEDTPARLIEAIGPDVLVKGADYEVHQIAGASSVLARGGRVETIELREGCSSSNVIERIKKSVGEFV